MAVPSDSRTAASAADFEVKKLFGCLVIVGTGLEEHLAQSESESAALVPKQCLAQRTKRDGQVHHVTILCKEELAQVCERMTEKQSAKQGKKMGRRAVVERLVEKCNKV